MRGAKKRNLLLVIATDGCCCDCILLYRALQVGNKCDLNDERIVGKDEGHALVSTTPNVVPICGCAFVAPHFLSICLLLVFLAYAVVISLPIAILRHCADTRACLTLTHS